MELDKYISFITRKLFSLPLASKIFSKSVEYLRITYTKKYANSDKKWTIISDYNRNLKLKIDRSSYMASCIYWYGYHHNLQVLKKLLSDPEMVFIDIGANFGEFTIYAADKLTKGRVIAFEPVEYIYINLIENIKSNKFENVKTYNFGLSNKKGYAPIYVSDDVFSEKTFHSFHEGLATLYPIEGRTKQIGEIKLDVLDDVFPREKLNRVDIIKIDVEGAELPILRGSEKLLRLYKPTLILEVSDITSKAGGYTVDELADFLESLNYKFFSYSRDKGMGQLTRKELNRLASYHTNVICKC